MIVNIRGTNGSGKTTVANAVLSAYQMYPVDHEGKPWEHVNRSGYRGSLAGHPDVFLVGSYMNVCGGCDAVKTQDEVCELVRTFAKLGNVLYEGVLVSTLFQRYLDLARELHRDLGHQTVFAFMDTPLKTCIERIEARRAARGTEKPLNPKNATDKWNLMHKVYSKFGQVEGAALKPVWLPHQDAVAPVLELLKVPATVGA